MTSNSPVLAPTSDDVYRDGKLLVVRRGGDVSDRCAKCGRPAAGPAYIRRLGGGGASGGASGAGFGFDAGDGVLGLIGLVVGLFVLLLYVVSLLADLADRRDRVVLVGLCDEHQRVGRNVRRLGTAGWLAAGAAAAGATAAVVRPPHAAAACVTVAVACGLTAVAGLTVAVVGRRYPNLRLAREGKGRMWVSGFAAAAVDGRPAWPTPPTPPARNVHAKAGRTGRPAKATAARV